MPDRLTFVTAVSGGGFGLPMGAVDVRVTGTGAQASVRISDYGGGDAYLLTPGGNGNFTASSGTSIASGNRRTIDLPDRAGASLREVAIDDAFDSWDAGGRSSFDVQLSTTAFYGDRAALLGVRIGSVDMVYVGRADGDGVAAYERASNGALTRVDWENNDQGNYLGGVSTLAMAEVGGNRFLFAGSALEDGITAFSISSSGRLTETGHLGGAHQLPIQTVTALDTVTIGGNTYLIAAGAGSSSLSVMEVRSNGTLAVTDHVLDGRGTRFDGVTEMASVETGGMVFVAVAGADHGLSLLTLTDGGKLIHLDTAADSTDIALGGVSGLAMVETSRGLEIITTAGGEGGVNHFRVDLDPFQQSGLSGDDIIVDTSGSDTLQGGAGSDVFFLIEDDQHDVIEGLVVGEDQIDLSGWTLFYDVDQLTINGRGWGAFIAYGDETLDLRTANNQSLSSADVAALIMPGVNRIAVQEYSSMEFPERLVDGTNSADNLRGSHDSDKVFGRAGNDMLIGLSGADTLYGGSGNDTLNGGDGDDRLQDASGQDHFFGETGDDTVSYYDHRSGVTVNLATGANSSGDTYSSIESLRGSSTAADDLTGDASDNHLSGYGGRDTIAGGRGDDTLSGGDGSDRLEDASGRDNFIGGTGNDTVSYFDHKTGVTVDLSTGDNSSGDTYSSIASLRGSNEARDELTGHAGNNRLQGHGGNDRIFGKRGNDTLEGGAGNDLLDDASGTDLFIGGSGSDTASYFDRTVSLTANLATGHNNSGDSYSGIENLRGSNFAGDMLTGDAGNNRLQGYGGNDRIFGGKGNDRLEGGAGNDYLRDESGADDFIGGSGQDTVSYYGRDSGIAANLSSGSNNSGDSYSSIEHLIGSNGGNDTLLGHGGDNRLRGFDGDDTIAGRGGDDTLEGGLGDDYLVDASGRDHFIGGLGDDTVSYFDHQSGVTVNLSTGANSSGDTYSSIASLRGSRGAADDLTGHAGDNRLQGHGGDDRLFGKNGNDTLEGGSGDDYLRDDSGADRFIGGSGQDTVSYYGRYSAVSVNLETGANNSADSYSGIEHVIGSNRGYDSLTGDGGENYLRGVGGKDRIFGGRGDDTLSGGAGNDYLRDESGADDFIGGTGQDTVSFYGRSSGIAVNLKTGTNNSGDSYSSIEHLIGSNGGNDTLIGHDGNNRLRGFDGDDTLAGRGGRDTLDGGAGDDFLTDVSGRTQFIGGSGDDTVSYYDHNSGVTVNLSNGTNSSGDTYSSIANLRGSNKGADDLTGHAGDNRLQGHGGNDRLFGKKGDDTLNGGSGNDYLRDDSGLDRFDGGSGNDTVSYYGRAGGVTVNLETGKNDSGDRYYSIENIFGSNRGSDHLTGDEGDNYLRGFRGHDRLFGERGNDTLDGGSGDDYLRDDSGADTFIGGTGDDTVSYYGHGSGVSVNLSTGANSSGDSYSSIENLMGSNFAPDVLTGNNSDNRLWGFGGRDRLNGGGGDDLIEGGRGRDTLTGGAGADDFVFEHSDGKDIITDFDVDHDMIIFDIDGLDFSDLRIRTTSGGVSIAYDDNNTVALTGVSASDLGANDFDFI